MVDGNRRARPPVFYKGQMLSAETLARDTTFGINHWRIMAFLVSQMGWDNQAVLNQADIVRELSIDPSRVSVTVRDLETRGYLRRFKRRDKRHVFEINPDFAQCGPGDGQDSATKNWTHTQN